MPLGLPGYGSAVHVEVWAGQAALRAGPSFWRSCRGTACPLSGGVGWTAWCGLCLSCAKTVPWPAHASSACVAGLGRCRAVRKTRKRMRKASSSCWVTSTGCWLAAMQIVPAHTESGAYGAAGGKACDGGCAGPDALSRAGVKQHPKRQEVHKGNLSCKLTCTMAAKPTENHNPEPCKRHTQQLTCTRITNPHCLNPA